MPIKNMFKNKNGDTIVEVLLSIAVLSLVLSISFALSNRNSQYTQQSQERSEAQNISQQQIEELRKYLTPSTPWQTTYRCFDDLGQPSSGSGNSCSKGTKDNGVGRYNVTITATDTDGDGKAETYTVSTIWSSLTGAAQQSQAFSYKLPVSSLGPTGAAAICSDGDDNDGDGAIDSADPGCHSDANASNGSSYVASDSDETDPACKDSSDNDGDGLIDYPADPGCADILDINEYNPIPIKLTVQKSPNDGGTVTGSGINCGSTCEVNNITTNTNITLTATPAPNYVFTGWNPSSCNSFTIDTSTTCTANFTYVPRVPLYRCFTYSDFNHYYTPYSWLCYNGIQALDPNRQYEGIVGYVPTGGPYPSLYVYGGYHAGIGDSFYTTSYDEYVAAHYGGYWNSSGYQGFSLYSDCSVPGTIPLYRFWHAGVGDHLYTTNWWEGYNAGFSYEGIQGCLFASP